jgi:hypothetical protein
MNSIVEQDIDRRRTYEPHCDFQITAQLVIVKCPNKIPSNEVWRNSRFVDAVPLMVGTIDKCQGVFPHAGMDNFVKIEITRTDDIVEDFLDQRWAKVNRRLKAPSAPLRELTRLDGNQATGRPYLVDPNRFPRRKPLVELRRTVRNQASFDINRALKHNDVSAPALIDSHPKLGSQVNHLRYRRRHGEAFGTLRDEHTNASAVHPGQHGVLDLEHSRRLQCERRTVFKKYS